MQVKPIHSPYSVVYHNNRKCTTRNNIEKRNVRLGTGGKRKRLCKECAQLNKEGK